MRTAATMALSWLAVAAVLASVPAEAAAKGGRGVGGAVSTGASKALGQRSAQSEKAEETAKPTPRPVPQETDAVPASPLPAGTADKALQPAMPRAPQTPAVAAGRPLQSNAVECIAGCYDGFGRPVRR